MQRMPLDLQLPPIKPAPPRVGVDLAMTQQQSRAEQPSGNGTTRQPDPKRPKVSDVLRND